MSKVIQLGEFWKIVHAAESKRIYEVEFQIHQFTNVNYNHICHLLMNLDPFKHFSPHVGQQPYFILLSA